MLHEIGEAVSVFCARSEEIHATRSDVLRGLAAKRIGYSGEEVAKLEPLSASRITPALPPLGHGGSIPVVDGVSEGTKRQLGAPELLLPEEFDGNPKLLQAKLHIVEGERDRVADLLVEHGVCEWIDGKDVKTFQGTKLLDGMFGVAKSDMTPQNETVLRVIMNFIPLNRLMKVIGGGIENLPHITQWLSLAVCGSDEVYFHQSDMSAAFYLFELPRCWRKWMCFNIERSGQFLCCRVLPMGWSASVGVMQEVSARILVSGGLPSDAQITKTKPPPVWFNAPGSTRETTCAWWQVYLDNFVAGERCRAAELPTTSEKWHLMTENQWEKVGVLSSAKKRTSNATTVEELGAFIDGPNKTKGVSPARILKLVHSSLLILGLSSPPRKLVQIVLGRWIYLLQYRRPGMAIFSESWKLIYGRYTRKKVMALKEELWLAISLLPLLHTCLDATVLAQVTCSDASLKGGAVAVSDGLTQQGAELENRLGDPVLKPYQSRSLFCPFLTVLAGHFAPMILQGLCQWDCMPWNAMGQQIASLNGVGLKQKCLVMCWHLAVQSSKKLSIAIRMPKSCMCGVVFLAETCRPPRRTETISLESSHRFFMSWFAYGKQQKPYRGIGFGFIWSLKMLLPWTLKPGVKFRKLWGSNL